MVEMKSAVVLVIVMIGINLTILEFAKLNIGIECPNLEKEYIDVDGGVLNSTSTWDTIRELVAGRCDGMPRGLILLVEIPLFVGLLLLINEFIPFT